MSFLQQTFQVKKDSPTESIPRAIVVEEFGSNQERIAQMNSQQADLGILAGGGTLRQGSRGDAVKALQRILGFTGSEVDGIFGRGTKAAVIAWQRDNGLSTDGVVGRNTIAAMSGGGSTTATPTADTAAPATEAPAPATEAPAPATEAPAAETAAQAPAERLEIGRTLRLGSSGEDVKALQRFLGLSDSGNFDAATRTAVIAWQRDNKLGDDGIVGTKTVAAMNGDKQLYGHSRHHDPSKFVPAFPMMAYHESGSYRNSNDPYAVGTITNPNKDDDLGGKTYGTYQFESYIYANGTKNERLSQNSTVMRFSRWSKNPYSAQLMAVINTHGVASSQFDALWRQLSSSQNKAFGEAQQEFLRHDKGGKAREWMKRADLSDTVQSDDAFFDLVLGTLNHVGTLANSTADHLAALKEQRGRDLTVEEAAVALTDHKMSRVSGWFKSSPGAHAGIRNRFRDEQNAFRQ